MAVRLQRPPITDDSIDRPAGFLVRPAAREPLPVVLLHAAQACVHSRCFNASTSDRGARRWSSLPGGVWRSASAARATTASAPFALAGAGANVLDCTGGLHGA